MRGGASGCFARREGCGEGFLGLIGSCLNGEAQLTVSEAMTRRRYMNDQIVLVVMLNPEVALRIFLNRALRLAALEPEHANGAA